jgi:AcrR family transcriptional regulator
MLAGHGRASIEQAAGCTIAAMAKLTRKEAKALTRAKLISALIDLTRSEGIGALSTTAVTRAAGVAQSVFYDHFKDMDQALTVAAEKVGGRVRAAIADARAQLDLSAPAGPIRASYAAAVDGLMAEPVLTELLLRHRSDPLSPLGECMRGILANARTDIIADLERLGVTEASLLQSYRAGLDIKEQG